MSGPVTYYQLDCPVHGSYAASVQDAARIREEIAAGRDHVCEVASHPWDEWTDPGGYVPGTVCGRTVTVTAVGCTPDGDS